MRNKTHDLSQGKIFPALMTFALPLLLGQLLQTLYSSVDQIVIGNFETTNALAAISASTMITNMIAGFFNGLSVGASVFMAKAFGAKDYKTLHDGVHTTVLSSFIFGVVLAGAGAVCAGLLLHLTKCPPEVYENALTYLRIYMVGVLFTSMYNVSSGVLRAVGNSRVPFIALATSSCLNIVLDIVFVAFFKWSVAGVAIATIISQGVSMTITFSAMMKLDAEYRFRFRHLTIKGYVLKEVVRLGLPAGLQSSVTALSNIFIQRYLNMFSPAAIAALGAGMKIDQFAGMPCHSLGLAMTTFIGQNVGAKKLGRTHKSVGVSTLACVSFIAVVGTFIYFFAPQLVGIFSKDPEVIYYGTQFLKTIMPLYSLMGLGGLFAGICRGYGYSIYSMLSTLLGMVAVRQIWLFIAFRTFEKNVLLINVCYPMGWIVTLLPQLILYLFVLRKKFKAEPETT